MCVNDKVKYTNSLTLASLVNGKIRGNISRTHSTNLVEGGGRGTLVCRVRSTLNNWRINVNFHIQCLCVCVCFSECPKKATIDIYMPHRTSISRMTLCPGQCFQFSIVGKVYRTPLQMPDVNGEHKPIPWQRSMKCPQVCCSFEIWLYVDVKYIKSITILRQRIGHKNHTISRYQSAKKNRNKLCKLT